MNTQKLLDTIETIKNDNYPVEFKHFGGAHLGITNKPVEPLPKDADWLTHSRYDDDVCVVTSHAAELSWLVSQLQGVFSDEIDYMNKFTFYPGLGNAMNEGLLHKKALSEIMLFVIIQSILFWIIPPNLRTKKEMIMDMLVEKVGPIPEPEEDNISIGQILRANEEGKSIAEDRNSAIHNWINNAI